MQFIAVQADGRPQPKGRKAVIMMTLRELMNKADEAAWVERVPSVVQLIESETPIICSEKMGDEIEVTAFQNGYVIYQNGTRATVFPIHISKDYVEKSVTEEEHVIPFAVFADQPWQIRAFMEGEKRLVHNTNGRRYLAGEISYDASFEGWDMLSDEGENDPLHLILEEETRREEKAELYRMIETLTEKQRFVLIQCVVKGRMQIDVAEELGTTRMNVTIMLQKCLDRLREQYGIQGGYFGTNHFYRPKK